MKDSDEVLEHAGAKPLKDAGASRVAGVVNASAKVRNAAINLIRNGNVEQAQALLKTIATEPGAPRFARAELPDLSRPPPVREWLAFDRRTRRKLLRMGKAFMLASDGGVGKSFFWLQLAVCLALGRDLFDSIGFGKTGHSALFMGEDDLQECHDRLYRICNVLHVGDDQREAVRKFVHLYPLMGQEISLLAVNSDGNAIRTAIFDELVAHLAKEANNGGFEWTFIGFDPLARFAADAETSNALATAFVQGLEAIIEGVPGRPALGCTHHSSKVSNRSGDVDARGVTGTRNAFRAELKLLKVTTELGLQGVLLTNSKNNLAREADDQWQVRCQDEEMDCGGHIPIGGVLVAATPEQADELQAARGSRRYATPAERSEAKRTQVSNEFEQQCDELLSILPVAPANQSIAQIEGALRKKGKALSHHTIRALLAHLAENGRARDLSNGKRSTPRQWAATGESSNR